MNQRLCPSVAAALPRYRFVLMPSEVAVFRRVVAAENAEVRRGRPNAIPAAFVGPPEAITFDGAITTPLYGQTVRLESHEAALWLSMRWALVQQASKTN